MVFTLASNTFVIYAVHNHPEWSHESSLSDLKSDLCHNVPNLQMNFGQICQNMTQIIPPKPDKLEK